jgi:hypothetical protein
VANDELVPEARGKAVQGTRGFMLTALPNLELGLVADQETLWNPTYLMVQRALKLSSQISPFCAKFQDKDNNALDSFHVLSRDDWATLHAVNDILQPSWKVSLRLRYSPDVQDEYSRYCNEPILKKASPHLLKLSTSS